MKNRMAQIQVVGKILVIVNAYMYVCSGQRESFSHKIQVNEESFGQLKLDSSGYFANIIHLDTVEGIKRLLCRHDKILIAFKEFETVPNWLPGQIILGSSKWTCSLPDDKGRQSNGIYGKIQDVFRPKDGRLDLVIGPIGPLDLLEEAKIHFHYNPFASEDLKDAKPRRTSDQPPNRRVYPTVVDKHKPNRTKRRISNMLTDILNQIDWHRNVSMFVPFNYDPLNHRHNFQFSLKRKHGSDEMHVSAGPFGIKDLLKVPEYFSLDCISCFSVASIKYTLDLKIEKIDNKPVVKQYISQVEAHLDMNTDFALRFREEMSINASKLFWRTRPKELLRIPIAVVPGLPPVELLIRYDFDVYVDVHARVNGPAMLRNKYVTAGSYVMSQSLASKAQLQGDVSVYNWTIKPLDGRSMLSSLADVTASFKHRMGFNASLVWSGKDVSIMMSPQTDITVEPVVSNYVHSDYFKKCLRSSVTVGGDFNIKKAYFDVQAFGKEIWNTYLANGYKKTLSMVSKELHNECKARCTGPVVTGDPNEIEAVLGTSRAHLSQNHSMVAICFRDLRGDAKLFSIGEDGNTSCTNASEDLTKDCATRLVTKTMATKLARLHMFTKTEWSNRYVVAAEGLDESADFNYNMSSSFNMSSPFKDGRAMTLGLMDDISHVNASSSLSNNINKTRRLGQLAVCAGFDYVAITNISGQLVVVVGVNNVTEDPVLPSIPGAVDGRTIFNKAMQSAGSDRVGCPSKTQFKTGDRYPSGETAESWCGPSTGRIHFLAPSTSTSLYEYPYNDIKFKAEGSPQDWCGSELRRCNSCNQSSITGPMISWDSCITRLMTPRLALRLRKLANIAKRDSLDLQVEKALAVDSSDTSFNALDTLFFEGRAARITLVSPGSQSNMNLLMNAAICAEFDFVRYTSPQFVDVFVRRQDGYIERKIFFPSGRGFVSVRSHENLTSEYGYPRALTAEAQKPALIDGHDDTIRVSKYYTISDFKDNANRDVRLDPGLVECLQESSEELGRKVDILPRSAYKTRSANLINYDMLHREEMLRHQAGQAARVKLGKSGSTNDLVRLGKSLMRKCIPLLQQQQRTIGIGCYNDSLYIDIRPILAGEETAPMHVWNSGGDDVHKELEEAADKVNNGGPLISPIHYSSACSPATMVSTDKPYLSFQLGYSPQCSLAGSGVSAFCQKTRQYLREQGSNLQKRLTSAAGSDRLPRRDIIYEINACVVDACGGCPGTGPIWDRKVRSCSKMIGKFLSRASRPFREMANKTAFFNPDNDQSTVHSLACHDGNICIENVQLYSLLMPLITAKYTVKSGNSVEEMLFNNEDNPSPLLELVAQELAMHTSGVVKVYIDSLGDISRIRNVLKVAMVFNKNVSHVEFHISGNVNKDSVMATIQRKVEIWSGTACSDVSRLTIAPFSIHTIHEHRLKRSIERSQARNQEKLRIRNWEIEWVSKL